MKIYYMMIILGVTALSLDASQIMLEQIFWYVCDWPVFGFTYACCYAKVEIFVAN